MTGLHFPDWALDSTAPAQTLREQGFVLLRRPTLAVAAGIEAADFAGLCVHWQDLPADEHLRDGGRYRFRRHASLRLLEDGRSLQLAAPRPHWQPLDYNALHGGFERWFAPCSEAFIAEPALVALVCAVGRIVSAAASRVPSYVELHQFRITTDGGIGRPTPEGAHRDGVDYVAVILVDRQGVRGGETRIFEAEGPAGMRFTLLQPWTALLLDDARVIHETTPLQPEGEGGHRDTLVLTFRHDGFLDPP